MGLSKCTIVCEPSRALEVLQEHVLAAPVDAGVVLLPEHDEVVLLARVHRAPARAAGTSRRSTAASRRPRDRASPTSQAAEARRRASASVQATGGGLGQELLEHRGDATRRRPRSCSTRGRACARCGPDRAPRRSRRRPPRSARGAVAPSSTCRTPSSIERAERRDRRDQARHGHGQRVGDLRRHLVPGHRVVRILEHAGQVGGADERGSSSKRWYGNGSTQRSSSPICGAARRAPGCRTPRPGSGRRRARSRARSTSTMPLCTRGVPPKSRRRSDSRHAEAPAGRVPVVASRVEDALVPGVRDDEAAEALLERDVRDRQLVRGARSSGSQARVHARSNGQRQIVAPGASPARRGRVRSSSSKNASSWSSTSSMRGRFQSSLARTPSA